MSTTTTTPATNEQCAPLCLMLTCKDIGRSVAFYRDVLGFKMKEAWPDKEKPMWCNMMLDGQSVMLGAAMDPAHAESMCGGDAEAAAQIKTCAEEMKKNISGVGIVAYVMVKDVDAYHAACTKRGLKASQPKTQFYGLRDFSVQDPEGFRFQFYSPIAMSECQSCGMPLKDAVPGQMYCSYCTDEKGQLKSYEQVLEGTASGYFMQMQKMPREKALAAAKEHLSKYPAWKSRGK